MNDQTNITQEHIDAMHKVTGGAHDIVLMSVFVNGEPASAICEVIPDGKDKLTLVPMFVSITPSMRLTNHEGEEPTEKGSRKAH